LDEEWSFENLAIPIKTDLHSRLKDGCNLSQWKSFLWKFDSSLAVFVREDEKGKKEKKEKRTEKVIEAFDVAVVLETEAVGMTSGEYLFAGFWVFWEKREDRAMLKLANPHEYWCLDWEKKGEKEERLAVKQGRFLVEFSLFQPRKKYRFRL